MTGRQLWISLLVSSCVCACKTARYEFVGDKGKSGAEGNNSGAEDGLTPKPGSDDAVAQLPPEDPDDTVPGVPLELPPTARVEILEEGKIITQTKVNRKVLVRPSQDTMDGDNISDPGNCPNPGIIEARYDFGNGQTRTVKREPHDCKSLGVEHQWPQDGLFEVKLVVVSDEKEEAQSNISFSVLPTSSNPTQKSPSFIVAVVPAIAEAGSIVVATGTCSTPTPHRITWDFGDAESGSGAEVQHSYKTKGQFIVTGLCTDQSGLTLESSATVLVVKKMPPPDPGQNPGKTPTPVQNPGQSPQQK